MLPFTLVDGRLDRLPFYRLKLPLPFSLVAVSAYVPSAAAGRSLISLAPASACRLTTRRTSIFRLKLPLPDFPDGSFSAFYFKFSLRIDDSQRAPLANLLRLVASTGHRRD